MSEFLQLSLGRWLNVDRVVLVSDQWDAEPPQLLVNLAVTCGVFDSRGADCGMELLTLQGRERRVLLAHLGRVGMLVEVPEQDDEQEGMP